MIDFLKKIDCQYIAPINEGACEYVLPTELHTFVENLEFYDKGGTSYIFKGRGVTDIKEWEEDEIRPGTVLVKIMRLPNEVSNESANEWIHDHSDLIKHEVRIANEVRSRLGKSVNKDCKIGRVYGNGMMMPGRPFMVMPYYEDATPLLDFAQGRDYRGTDNDARNKSTADKMKLLFDTFMGVMQLKEAGIVHRDLKPDNVIQTHGGVGDFSAKIIDLAAAVPVNANGTYEGKSLGSKTYCSPEQALNAKVRAESPIPIDHRSDLYSYALLYLRILFNAQQDKFPTLEEKLDRPVFERKVASLCDGLELGKDHFCREFLKYTPEERHLDVKDTYLTIWMGMERLCPHHNAVEPYREYWR